MDILDVDPTSLPSYLVPFLTSENGLDVDGLVGTNGDVEEGSDLAEIEAERRRKRWTAKYGAEAPGAALAALVGILYVATILLFSLAEVNYHYIP